MAITASGLFGLTQEKMMIDTVGVSVIIFSWVRPNSPDAVIAIGQALPFVSVGTRPAATASRI